MAHSIRLVTANQAAFMFILEESLLLPTLIKKHIRDKCDKCDKQQAE